MNYSAEVIDYFENTDHAGVLQNNTDDVYIEQSGVVSRELFELSLKIDGDRIMAARFRAFGPPALIALGEWLCRQLEQKNVGYLFSMSETMLLEALDLSGILVPVAALVMSTVKAIGERVN